MTREVGGGNPPRQLLVRALTRRDGIGRARATPDLWRAVSGPPCPSNAAAATGASSTPEPLRLPGLVLRGKPGGLPARRNLNASRQPEVSAAVSLAKIELVEATAGVERRDRSFAGPCLTAWLCRRKEAPGSPELIRGLEGGRRPPSYGIVDTSPQYSVGRLSAQRSGGDPDERVTHAHYDRPGSGDELLQRA